jgi:hypothetical protein
LGYPRRLEKRMFKRSRVEVLPLMESKDDNLGSDPDGWCFEVD